MNADPFASVRNKPPRQWRTNEQKRLGRELWLRENPHAVHSRDSVRMLLETIDQLRKQK